MSTEVDLRDACSDWSTVGLQFGQMSPTNVADVIFVSPKKNFFIVGDAEQAVTRMAEGGVDVSWK